MTAKQAAAKPVRDAHSIWEIVRHLTAWTHEADRRLAGHPCGNPPEGDWPKTSGSDAASWHRDRELLFAAHRRLLASIAKLSDDDLQVRTNDPRARSGKGSTRYVLLHGIVQHHAYHGGQISLIKKAGG